MVGGCDSKTCELGSVCISDKWEEGSEAKALMNLLSSDEPTEL